MNSSTVILPWLNSYTFSFEDIKALVYCVEDHYLTDAFSQLSFTVEHHAASKSINLFIKRTTRMSTSACNLLILGVLNIMPRSLIVTYA
jgi:hypothetical protein